MANIIYYENTHFGSTRNFSGDPNKSNFNSPEPMFTIMITMEEAERLTAMGCNVYGTKPKEGVVYENEFVPQPFIYVKATPKDWAPINIYIMGSTGVPSIMPQNTYPEIDEMSIDHIDITMSVGANGGFYLKSLMLYPGINQEDPIRAMYDRYVYEGEIGGTNNGPDEVPFV